MDKNVGTVYIKNKKTGKEITLSLSLLEAAIMNAHNIWLDGIKINPPEIKFSDDDPFLFRIIEYNYHDGSFIKDETELKNENTGELNFFSWELMFNRVRTDDGYVFERQPDGSYSDGDMTYDSLEQLLENSDYLTPLIID